MNTQQPIQPPYRPESRSRKFWRVVLGSMLGFFLSSVIVGILAFLMFFGIVATLSVSTAETVSIKDGSILKIDLRLPIVEQGVDNPLSKFSWFDSYATTGLDDIIAVVEAAADDSRIKGICLNPSAVAASPATVREIRNALLRFKKSGKFIYAYGELFTQSGYYIASVADKIMLNPGGAVDFKGYALQVMFYKGLLEKMDVDVQIVRHGQFKSAVEPYFLDKMSGANRRQMDVLAHSLWNTVLDDVSASRKIPVDELNRMADALTGHSADDALRCRLVDCLGYYSDMEARLRDKTGLAPGERLNFVSVDKYKKAVPSPAERADRIAVVYANGSIYDGKGSDNANIYSENFIKELRKAVKDKSVKAIVLRINSPGGSSMASENIWKEIEAAKQSGRKVVTSMGDYAASGGYYIACNSDYIVAQPNTLTGSIGVFGMLPSLRDALKNKLGVTVDGVATNRHSDFGSLMRPLDSEEMDVLQADVEKTYGTFIRRVADGRGLTPEAVDSIGQGRVWAGADALQIGLVDTLGNIGDAVAKAAELAGLHNYSIVCYPKRTDVFDMLFNNGEEEMETAIRHKLGSLYFTYQGLSQLMENRGVQARMPMEIDIQ